MIGIPVGLFVVIVAFIVLMVADIVFTTKGNIKLQKEIDSVHRDIFASESQLERARDKILELERRISFQSGIEVGKIMNQEGDEADE